MQDRALLTLGAGAETSAGGWRGHVWGAAVAHAPWLATLLGVALASPSLGAGFGLDSEFHREVALRDVPVHLLNLFDFSSGSPHDVYATKDAGRLPWLAVEDYRVRFWRPLASLTHVIDYRLSPSDPLLHHVHGLVWFAFALFAVASLYRRTLPGGVAALAALLYAVDDAHGFAVGWVANRNASMATGFGALALAWHHRARIEGWRPGVVLAPLGFLAALASAELAVGLVGYFAAHLVFVERAGWKRRVRAAVPWVVVVAAWALFYRWGGYGARGCPTYLDPVSEPFSFATGALWKAPLLFAAQFGAAPAGSLAVLPAEAWLPFLTVTCALCALVAWVLGRWLERDRTARFYGAGCVFAILPACAALPTERLLFIVGLGAMPLVAAVGSAYVTRHPWTRRPGAWRLAASVTVPTWIVAHGILAPALLPLTARGTAAIERALAGEHLEVDAAPPADGEVLVALTAPSYLHAGAALAAWTSRAQGTRVLRRVLHAGPGAVVISRRDERTLVVVSETGFGPGERPREHPVRAGYGLYLTGMLALVREVTPEGLPRVVEFTFAHPLEDPRYRWVVCGAGTLAEVAVPAIGEHRTLRATP